MSNEPKDGDLRVWWIPQVPMKAFTVPVDSLDEGRKLCDVLADYDRFQYENNVKPDYVNMGGIQVYEPDGDGGMDWFDAWDENGDNAW